MARVISFTDYTAIPRYDEIPWAGVYIEERALDTPTWTLIDTINFSPVDIDPAKPRARNFSTSNVTITEGYVRVVFFDASAAIQETDPLYYTIERDSVGKIAEATRAILPMTWDRLSSVSWYGTDLLLSRVEIAKNTIYPVAIATADESTYTTLMIEYAAKTAALEIIPAGIEYWMNQTQSISTTGTAEVKSYTDRANQLRELAKWLQGEVVRLAGLSGLADYLLPPGDLPEVADNTEDYMLTESPYDFPPAFGPPTSSSLLFGSNE